MAMREQLHDEIDSLEELRDDTRAIVRQIHEDLMRELLLRTGFDVRTAMGLVAREVENALADETTRAFRAGVEFSRRRRRA